MPSGTYLQAKLAETLLVSGHADAGDWNGDTKTFLLRTLTRWIVVAGGPDVDDYFGFRVTLVSDPSTDMEEIEYDEWRPEDERHGSAALVDPAGRVFLNVHATSHAGTALGVAAAALAAIHPRLASTVWAHLHGAVSMYARVWDHVAALRMEMQDHWPFDEESLAQYSKAELRHEKPSLLVPKHLQRKPLGAAAARRLLRSLTPGSWEAALLSGALNLWRVAEKGGGNGQRDLLPTDGAAFYEHAGRVAPTIVTWIHEDGDALSHAWDAHGSDLHTGSGPQSPICCWPFDPRSADSVAATRNRLAAFCDVMHRAGALLALLDDPRPGQPARH